MWVPKRISFALLSVLAFPTASQAITLFENPPLGPGVGLQWCDPCSSGNTGYRVWDSFTLSASSTLQSLRWLGLRSDTFTSVQVEINKYPYGQVGYISPVPTVAPPPGVPEPDIFSAVYNLSDISFSLTGINSNTRTVALPNVVLGPGNYFLSVHGTTIATQHTWLGVVEPGGNNSLIQYGPDPDAPTAISPRLQDAVFRLSGEINAVPAPLVGAGLPGFIVAGIGLFELVRRRRKQRG